MQAEATFKMSCSYEHAQKNTRTHTHTHSLTHTNTFTLCLCGLSEPAKLPFLLLSKVSQCDPLVLPTCTQPDSRGSSESVHSRTREERMARDSCNTNYRHSYHHQLQYNCSDCLCNILQHILIICFFVITVVPM